MRDCSECKIMTEKDSETEIETRNADKNGSTPAERALAEAAERRAKAVGQEKPQPVELNGPRGLEPTRYGDWEKGGLTSDF
jgi:hypothetical protein